MLSQAAPQSICARHSATPTMTTAIPSDAIVLRVRRRLVREGGSPLTSGSPRTGAVVTAGTLARGPRRFRVVDRRATGPTSGRTRGASQPRQQRSPSRHGTAPRDGPLALRKNPSQLIELRVLVALAGRTAVPLPDLVHALQRCVGEGDGAELGGTGLDDPPHSTVPSEMRVGPDGRAQHRTIDEVESRAVPDRHLRLGWGRFRIADKDLANRAHRKESALAVLVDRSNLRVEDREIKGDLGRFGENHLTVDEIDDDDGHLKSVTFRSQVPPKAAVGSVRRSLAEQTRAPPGVRGRVTVLDPVRIVARLCRGRSHDAGLQPLAAAGARGRTGHSR